MLDKCTIHPTAVIDVQDLVLGEGTQVGAYARISGTKVHIGRDSWIGAHSHIGGGSCFDPGAYLIAGDFFHVGEHAEVNTARGVVTGHEVGLGVQTRVFTHGAYLSVLDGFPVDFSGVAIGNRVWIPNGQVNPGVNLGSDIVVTPGSVISGSDWPTGSLIGGNPAKVIKEKYYPQDLSVDDKIAALSKIVMSIESRAGEACCVIDWPILSVNDDAWFNLKDKRIRGRVTPSTEIARHQLRRHGVRFRYRPVEGHYVPWL